jgi:hypothetical protein
MKTLRPFAALVFVGLGSAVFAQMMLNYVDPSADTRRSRRTTENTGTGATGGNARATPTPKGSPTPASGKSTPTSGKSMTTSKSTGSTSGTASGHGLAGKGTGKPSASGGSGNFEQTGKLQQVTKQMVESIRPHKVDFDENAAAQDPAVIILNPRRLTPPDERNVKTDSLARPL